MTMGARPRGADGKPPTNILLPVKELLSDLQDNLPQVHALVVAARGAMSGISRAELCLEPFKAGLQLRGFDINGLSCVPTMADIDAVPFEYTVAGVSSCKELWCASHCRAG